jgi:hypothetical protein
MAATITPESALNEDRFPNLETVIGNAIVPQQIYPILKAIAEIEGIE